MFSRPGGFTRAAALAVATAIGSITCGPARTADAAITITKANGSAVPTTAYSMIYTRKTGGWTINLNELYAPGSDSVFNIHGTAGENIDNLFINVNGPAAGSPVIVRVLSDAPNGFSIVRNIQQNGNAETLLNEVDVNFDVGSITVQAIGTVTAGRDVLGPVTATTPESTVRGITTIIASRDILGDCSAVNGKIGLIYAYGNIGSPGVPVTLQAKNNIVQCSAEGDMYASVVTRLNGSAGKIWGFTANRFFGTLETETVMTHPSNGLPGLIWIGAEFDGLIVLGKGFNGSGQYIGLPAGGLTDQIIINADNAAGQTWTAPVEIGPDGPGQIVLTGPAYTQSPSTVGGGSVGLVPFRLHSAGCTPTNGSNVPAGTTANPLRISLRHYGPITWLPGAPVTIERRIAGSSGGYTMLNAADFAFTLDLADLNTLIVGPAPGKPGFQAGFQYRLRATSLMRCNVSALPPVSWGADYLVTVTNPAPTCVGDSNGDNAVNIDDLTAVILNWASTAANNPGDIDDDGVVNINDYTAVVLHWGACAN